MIARKFKQSSAVEDWDTNDPGKAHKQFFMRGPRLVGTIDVSGEAHQEWEMDIQFAYTPLVQGDVDRFRFNLADEVAAIHVAMTTDATILQDEFEFLSSDPEYNTEADVWGVLITLRWLNYQAAL